MKELSFLESSYQCPSNGKCYAQIKHCDGHMDCEDGYDETFDCTRCQDLGMFKCAFSWVVINFEK